MKLSVFILLFCISLCMAVIPLPGSPSWTSNDNDYSTGGALYDITMDGWIDYCTGNGNDMAMNTNAIYINQNGILESSASWRSTEAGYFSHIYIGDVDNDGFPDMAVAYLGFGAANQGPTSIYRNTGNGLDQDAWWTSADQYNSFDCAFGDVDLDGDLDLAVAAGDAYSALESPTRVYRNNNGSMETTPYWTSIDSTPGDACRWVDLDNDGYLDLVVGYRHKLAAFTNIGGTLEQTASWSTAEPGWILRIAVGDYNNDGYKDIAVASNGQLGGDESQIEVYKNDNGVLQTPPEYVMLTSTSYCSCVEWGDANNDGWLDLAAGGWWEPVVVFENINGTINTTPAWSWSGGSGLVCETVMWGDVRNHALNAVDEYKSGDGTRQLFSLTRHPIQELEQIMVDDSILQFADFTHDPLTGWVSFANAPPSGSDNIKITYTYTQYPDLGVTNWNASNGNYLFSNTTVIKEYEIVRHGAALKLDVFPNPFSRLTKIYFENVHPDRMTHSSYGTGSAEGIELKIYDTSGRLVKEFLLPTAYSLLPTVLSWSGTDDKGQKLPSGVYIIELNTGKQIARKKVVITR
jgi:hypothetical protein